MYSLRVSIHNNNSKSNIKVDFEKYVYYILSLCYIFTIN